MVRSGVLGCRQLNESPAIHAALWTPPSVRTWTSRLRSSRHQSTTAKRYRIRATDTRLTPVVAATHGYRHLASQCGKQVRVDGAVLPERPAESGGVFGHLA